MNSLHDAFLVWMEAVAAEAHEAKPHIRPFPVSEFDGCSMVPDLVLACCYLHDVAYWHAETREERRLADRGFRECIIAKTEFEGPLWRWLWRLLAWVAWAGVRIFGRGVVSRRRRAWEKEAP